MKTQQRVLDIVKESRFAGLIIRYSHLPGRMLKPEQIFSIHLPGRHDIPGEILSQWPVPAETIARKAPCPVLLIPFDSKPVLKNILVLVDSSVNPGSAFESAIQFAPAAKINGTERNILIEP